MALLRTLKEIDDVFASVEAVQQFSSLKEFTIPPQFMQRVLKQLERCDHGFVEKSYKRSMSAGTGDRHQPIVYPIPAKLPITLHIEKEEENRLKLHIPEKQWQNLFFYEEARFIEKQGEFYFVTSKMMERIKRLKQAFSLTGDRGIVMAADQASSFVSRFLPQIEANIEVELPEEVAAGFVRTELIAELKVDFTNDELSVKPEFHYCVFVVEPIKEEAGNEPETGIYIRDIDKEKQLLKELRHASPEWEDENGEWMLKGIEAVGDFLYGAVPELMDDYRIMLTPAANKLFYETDNSPKLEIEWNQGSNMLDVSFSTENLSTDDLQLLMKQLSGKKKFVKLTSGKLVNLNTEAFQDLSESVNQLDLSWQEINKEMSVPVYKGLSLADKDEVGKGEHFRHLISRLFSPESIEFSLPSNLNATLRPYQEIGVKWL